MTKQSRAMNAFAKEAMKAEIDKADRKQKLSGVFNQSMIDTIKDATSRAEVQEIYDEYLKAVKSFNLIREQLVHAKANLQNTIDIPLFKGGLISSSLLWEIYKTDEQGNLYFRDSVANFQIKYSDWLGDDINKARSKALKKKLAELKKDGGTQKASVPDWGYLDTESLAFGADDTDEGTLKGTNTVPFVKARQ